ncbi:MAG: MMPL family transporter, partial [Candidatus Kariarchaeaceae archaeon]
MDKIEKLVRNLIKYRWYVLLFWGIITILFGFVFAPNIMNVAEDTFVSPKDSDVAHADELVKTYFPEYGEQHSHAIVVHNEEGLINQNFIDFTFNLRDAVDNDFEADMLEFAGYYVFAGTDLDFMKGNYISPDNSTSLITISFVGDSQNFGEETVDMVNKIRRLVKDLSNNLPDSFNVYTAGFPDLAADSMDSFEKDMATIDMIVIPIVFILLAVLLRNWKYFPLSMISIIISLLISIGAIERFVVATDTAFPAFVLNILFSLTLGVGVDYNLFLLSRFKEERLKGNSIDDSILTMMRYAGHTVFTSGLTLMIALAGLVLFPYNVISGIGVGVAFAIGVLLLVNLTFTPALLSIIGNWIEKPGIDNTQNKGKSAENENQTASKGIWYRIGKKAIKYNYGIIIIVLLFTIPLSVQIYNQDARSESIFYTPSGYESRDGFELLQEKFGAGTILPLQLIVVPQQGDVWSQNTFDRMHVLFNRLTAETSLDEFSMFSHVWMNGKMVEQDLSIAYRDPTSPEYNTTDALMYRTFTDGLISQSSGFQDKAAVAHIVLPGDPFSKDANELIEKMKDIMSNVFGNDFDWGLSGFAHTLQEAIEITSKYTPIVVLVVILGIYALVGFMFRSAILPARLILTIGLTVSFIYGTTVVVFENDTFLNEIFPELDKISVTFWMVPIVTFSIIIGLGMDYDIFTIERIKENVWNGMENNEAIAHGLDKTGRIITGAGLIMMVAFGGLMFSSTAFLIQFGFILAFAVFLDTFVVRTLLVPAIMSMAEDYN